MASVLPSRPNTNSTGTSASLSSKPTRQPSLASFPSNKHESSHPSIAQRPSRLPLRQRNGAITKPVQSQYPPDSSEQHVEYILVASFDIDRGSVMEHQYPQPVGGDEHMLAELMLPDQAHVRSQDWTIFFLHKDGAGDEDEEPLSARRKRRRRRRRKDVDGDVEARAKEDVSASEDDEEASTDEDSEKDDEKDDEESAIDGPPLVYVLNLVNTKQDSTVKRGAIVKAMAICTRHSFLHIYKPLLLLALQQYFLKPDMETLASLYDAVNSMDLSLMPRLTQMEKFILQTSDAKDLFLERFEAMIAQRMTATNNSNAPGDRTTLSPSSSSTHLQSKSQRYGLPRDTHEFESVVRYANVPVPVKIPTALSAETVGDFSLIKLISIFNTPHTTSALPFNPTHPHLTTNGPTTHPIIVLLNALLTQKRVIFLGHNLPSSDVAEAVLGACALASGGMLRGFTRHAFPYTDLTKIDDLLKVPGFIAGVTNPAFANKTEWWDLICDLGTGRMKISNRIEQAPLTEGVVFFQQSSSHAGAGSGVHPTSGISGIVAAGAGLSAGLGGSAVPTGSLTGDATSDAAFMANVISAINERHGENAIRSKFRRWVLKFMRLAAAFEEMVYGATPLNIFVADDNSEADLPPEVAGHGYVWPTAQLRTHELAANATRIEGWRTTRSYYNFIQDLAATHSHRPVKSVDLQHLHDMLAKLRLSVEQSSNIYLAICAAVSGEQEVTQLLGVVSSTFADTKGGGSGQGGLFFLALGLFHPRQVVREQVAELLGRVQEHEAGRHFWLGLGRFVRMGWERVMLGREVRGGAGVGEQEEGES